MSDMNDLPQKPKRRWIPIVLGIVFLIFVLGVGAVVVSVAWFRQALHVTDVSKGTAEQQFDAVRAKFSGQRPLLEMRDGQPAFVAERKDEPRSNVQLTTLHLMAWDEDEEQLVTFALPFWLLRMKSGPIGFSSYASGIDRVSLRVEDIEQHGPGLILDVTEDRRGKGRVLIWAE
jgi:flagellar basal body-associated protein FliL